MKHVTWRYGLHLFSYQVTIVGLTIIHPLLIVTTLNNCYYIVIWLICFIVSHLSIKRFDVLLRKLLLRASPLIEDLRTMWKACCREFLLPNQWSNFGFKEHLFCFIFGGDLRAPHSDIARFLGSFFFISISKISLALGCPMPRSFSAVSIILHAYDTFILMVHVIVGKTSHATY